jgi:hypothetical protein
MMPHSFFLFCKKYLSDEQQYVFACVEFSSVILTLVIFSFFLEKKVEITGGSEDIAGF